MQARGLRQGQVVFFNNIYRTGPPGNQKAIVVRLIVYKEEARH